MLSIGRARVSRPFVASPLLAIALVAAIAVSSVAAAPAARLTDAPPQAAPGANAKVVIIVGPTGELTNGFRAEAQAAARAARRYTNDVTTIYSPNATWRAVKSALQGANIVVYLGHGNGWPSPYRNSLYRRTQNGLGLNPVAGGNDHTHRHYGEGYLAREVRLAPGAIVLLHHLCYAAGNSEPGLPEGSAGVARQRVENYAAGWLATGAQAVVAEAYFGPSYYVRALLGTDNGIGDIWRASPTFNDNVHGAPSKRTEGATAYLDPGHRSGRFGRSLVVLESGTGRPTVSTPAGEPLPGEAPLAVTLGEPVIHGPIVLGTTVALTLPVELPRGSSLPQGIVLDARWVPVSLDDPDAAELGQPVASTDQPAVEPPNELSEARAQFLPATVSGRSLDVSLPTPQVAGAYELELGLHDSYGPMIGSDGQPLARTVPINVARPLSVAYDVPADLQAVAGEPVTLEVGLTNTGNISWQQLETDVIEQRGPDPFRLIPPEQARLVGRIVRLYAADGDEEIASDEPLVVADAAVLPGESAVRLLYFRAPGAAGDYVLILDVVTPSYGPLNEAGVASGTVLLHVGSVPLPESPPPTQ